ncbi:HEAT repeat domain-containing protein [Nocardioides solisilvae]|uniref:HEAT repeat domain-containing protein n=1 Tax=Nocardioides solisilvae TaxID=1542435 RepID=UPI000D746F7A|nr:HEAT repeat domain-containing protein [Nocardioides solisilvae]
MTLERLAWVAALACGVLCLAVVVLLVVVRLIRDRREERRLRTRAPVWNQVLLLTLGDPEEVEAATLALLRTSRSQRTAVFDDAFALVPKLKGDARDRLRQLMRDWGSLHDAQRLAASGSVVRRCRGMYQLGILADPASLPRLLRGLQDTEFAGRRSAMLALASYQGDEVVQALLDAAAGEVRLRHDFLATVDRIGGSAVPVLEKALAGDGSESPVDQRRQFLAAEALGLVGGHSAVPTLQAALGSGSDELVVACANALGDLGSHTSVMSLAELLDHDSTEVRRTAAEALGMIGGPGSVAFLAAGLRDPQVEVARAAAQALERCGHAGRRTLEASAAHPVVRETLALRRLVTAGG